MVSEVDVQLGRHDERIRDLEDWRKTVNGDLRDIKTILARIGWAIAATLGGVVVDLFLRLAERVG